MQKQKNEGFRKRNIFMILILINGNFLIDASISNTKDSVPANDKDTGTELKLVHLIWRHGDRNPEKTYRTDPYADPSFWPDGMGELTRKGQQDHEELGGFLRQRYNGFIQQHFDHREVYVLSSHLNRTVSSAYSNIKGFFKLKEAPPIPDFDFSLNSSTKGRRKLSSSSFPVRLMPITGDNKIFHITADCPRWRKLFTNAMNNEPEIVHVKATNQWIFDYISLHSGQDVKDFYTISTIYDILSIESSRNYTLPSWTSKIYPTAALEYLQAFAFKTATYNSEMRRLKAGPLFKDIVTHMEHHIEAKSGSKYRKLFAYSAHDFTLTALLDLMGVFDVHRPPYAALIMIELRKDVERGTFFVDILYRNDSSRQPYKLHPPGCPTSSCEFSIFINLFRKFIPINWKRECLL